jgi:hypothetical protein
MKRAACKKWQRKAKIDACNAYGGPICACCGEHRIEFLTLDHINNDGAEHRRQLFGTAKIGGPRLYRALQKLGYPPGLRVLCFNCNCARGFCGYCPHEREAKAPFTFIA